MRRMRSTSSGVLTEPSTSDRSYGPGAGRARPLQEVGDLQLGGDAEQFVLAVEQVSWQPSHEANLNTPSRGRAGGAVSVLKSQLPYGEQGPGVVVADDGAVAAEQQRPELAVSAMADATAHVAFERDPDAVGAHPPMDQRACGRADHDFGPADECGRVRRREHGLTEQRGDDSDPAGQPLEGRSTVTAANGCAQVGNSSWYSRSSGVLAPARMFSRP